MSLIKWITDRQPERGYLLAAIAAIHAPLAGLSLNEHLKNAVRDRERDANDKTPRWVSEFYLLAAMAIAVICYGFGRPIVGMEWAALFVVWPAYRVFELLVFWVGWVFVDQEFIHSTQRSLLTSVLNVVELALLFGSLEVTIGAGMPLVGKVTHLIDNVVWITTLTGPAAKDTVQHAIEMMRFFVGTLLVLVVLSSLAGSAVRRAADPEREWQLSEDRPSSDRRFQV